jgi:DNA topoisomerase-3
MGKKLIIAEKPSVAGDIARVLGGFKKVDDYFENDEYVVSSAVGHLLELVVPEEYDVKRGKWSFAHLPVIPPHFDLKPVEKTEARLKVLTRLLKRKDVDAIINACDAGREGELIFRYIMRHAKVAKPIQRLWLQSMTPAAIRTGFEQLRADAELLPLADAATCRSESDWLVGINGTRAMTAFNSKSGGFHKTPVGRVQTPTLAILVEREEKIKRFISRDYWEVHASFGVAAGEYPARWIDEQFARKKGEEDPDVRAERIWDEKRAIEISSRCEGKPGEITEESKPTTQLSPMLFDLTSLQRAANGRFGFSARMTLSIAQALYEKHKVLTYPRTDSRALPEDYIPTVKETLESLVGDGGGKARSAEHPYGSFAAKVLKNDWVRPNKRIFNNAKISDHFAIIPTALPPKHLSETEAKLYDLVVRRFLSVFYPAAEHLVTTRITRVVGEAFKSEGKVLKQAGWLEVHGKEVQEDDDANLVPVESGEIAKTETVNVVANQTKPPARYTEATLLTAMEGAGKLVEDEELREAMKERGLGTPATRAVIIEKLIAEEYVLRNQRELQATPKAFSLVTLLRGLEIPELTSPELTGEWEYRLKEMEQGKLSRNEFMHGIAEMTRHIVDRAKAHESDTVPGNYVTLETKCPKCNVGEIKENYKKFQCQNCDFAQWRILAGRQFEPREIEDLIRERRIGPLQGFRSRLGKPFAAIIKLNDEFKLEFDFGQQQGEGDGEPIDFSGQETLGPCPKCGSNVYEHGMAYICEKAVGAERACDFRSGKIILQRPIEVEQMKKLLIEGKTDLLHRFISKKGRPFSAFLVKGPDNKVSFEFAPKVAKIPTKAPPKTAAKAAAADDDDAPVKVAKAKAPAKAKAAPRARKTAT